jgi:hypothetical protein
MFENKYCERPAPTDGDIEILPQRSPDHIFRTKNPEKELMESTGPDLMSWKESRPYQDGIA